ncbi:polysialyltransferase family glycosyltransferase [Propionicicella superfundia]|uniref:polysialyltransferase family glycosyltransferase n=1 Tax=Propionicicella superfundia TaxID=348582 RepID=UPI0003F5D5F3|nr:polysialyltransferase family glycosyltransferase [Propionicicella superfundia]
MSHTGPRPLRVFLSGVRSQAHVVYAASWLRAQLAADPAPVTVVDGGLGGFLGAAPVTPGDLDRLFPSDPRLTRISPTGAGRVWASPDERLVYLAIGAPGIKPWLRLRAANPARRIAVVVTDEGLGSYGDWRSRRDAWRREGGGAVWSTARAVAGAAAKRLLVDERWALYTDTPAGWRLHEPVADEFRRPARSAPVDRAVFLTQPWVELGTVTDVAYRRHIAEVAAACTAAGYTFAVRPHPAEDASRYAQWDVLPGTVPAELDPRITSSAVVLGATSTALLNLAAIFRLPAYRVGGKELAVLDELLSPRQRALLDTYLPPTVEPSGLEFGR